AFVLLLWCRKSRGTTRYQATPPERRVRAADRVITAAPLTLPLNLPGRQGGMMQRQPRRPPLAEEQVLAWADAYLAAQDPQQATLGERLLMFLVGMKRLGCLPHIRRHVDNVEDVHQHRRLPGLPPFLDDVIQARVRRFPQARLRVHQANDRLPRSMA